MSLYIVKAKKTKLKAGLSATALQVTLDELVDSKGNPIVTASFGEWFVLVVKQSDQVEMIKCTAVTQNGNGSATCTVDPLGRNLEPIFPFTGTASSTYTFLAGAEVIVTNDPATVMSFANKKNDETVEGLWTFNQTPIGLNAGAVNDASTTAKGIGRASANPSVTLGTVTMTIANPAVFTLNNHGLTLNDMVKFTTTVSLPTGIVAGTTYYVISAGLTSNNFQLATAQGGTAIITTGSQSGTHTLYKVTPVFLVNTDTFYGTNNHATSTGSVNAFVLTLTTAPTAYVQGQFYSFKANLANTTACTLNVNGLGAKTIKKLSGSTDLASGDIGAGMVVEVMYDGTNFLLLNPVANAPYTGTPPNLAISSFTCAETLATGDPVCGYYGQSDGGILFDTKVSVATTMASGGGTVTLPITIGANSNRVVVVFVKAFSTGSGNVAPAPQFDGGAMTVGNSNLANQYNGGGSGSYYLINPATGIKNITWALPPSAGNPIGYIVSAYSFYNVYQSGVDGTQYTGGASHNYTITNLASLVVSCAMFNGAAPTGGTNMQNNQQSGTSGGGAGFLSGDGGQVVPIQVNTYGATSVQEMYAIALRPVTTASLGYVKKTSASTVANTDTPNLYNAFVGFVVTGGTFGQTATVQTDGVASGFTGLIPFATYYLSNTSGLLSTTAGTNSKKVGVALSTTTMLIKHDN